MNYWKIQTGIYLMYGGTSCTEAHNSLEAVVTETQRLNVSLALFTSQNHPLTVTTPLKIVSNEIKNWRPRLQ